MSRSYYSATIAEFIDCSVEQILGVLTRGASAALEIEQRDAWIEQIKILRSGLSAFREKGNIYFEYSVPRLGKRIDVLLLIDHVIFVLEFKVGEADFTASAREQVWDYALDLKNFHETSHHTPIVPVVVATRAKPILATLATSVQNDGVLLPVKANADTLPLLIQSALEFCDGPAINAGAWEQGRYCPTPTIVEAAMALYGGHSVDEISRNDASAINLSRTSEAVSAIIDASRTRSRKSICFVTGVPGAGKTLVGLNIATQHIDKESDLYSVFLSGNAPLVAILREALTRDKVRREKEQGRKATKGSVMSEVKLFVQNVHHFRDDCLIDPSRPPLEHVALFDEAQRAWNLEQTAAFMRRKKGKANFNQSEPEFLISCLNRHPDWAVVVCLVGGGQEINTGEAGISAWIDSLLSVFPDWDIHISGRLHDAEYGAGTVLKALAGRKGVSINDDLHLAVSMRSFRAEHVSGLVKEMLDLKVEDAHALHLQIQERYPIVLTRDVARAKAWLKKQARGSERYGMVVSSQAQRLKPHAIDVRSPMDPIHWFLDGKDDVRSSFYLEDVATEFHVQGLELDWACVVWDADFRYSDKGWRHFSFVGAGWNHIHKPERQNYLKNAYRVLLTRARQGMVIVVPEGAESDATRKPQFYDSTFDYLRSVGLQVI